MYDSDQSPHSQPSNVHKACSIYIYIYILKIWDLLLLLLCSTMMCTNNRIHYGSKVGPVCFTHYTMLLSRVCRRIETYRTSKTLLRHILSNVCLRLNHLSYSPFMQYMGLCVFSLPIPLMMIVKIRLLYLIIIKSEVWPIGHCLKLGH